MFIIALILLKTTLIEGRVFCQDSYALPWNPHGHPCPVSCSAVVSAINRLQRLDNTHLLEMQHNIKNKTLLSYYAKRPSAILSSLRKDNKMAHLYATYLTDAKFVDDFERELSKLAAILGPRRVMAERTFGAKGVNASGANGMRESRFVLRKLTELFNRHAAGRHRFDEKSTKMILEEMVGHLILRFGVSDVRRILYHLLKTLRYNKARSRSELIITLRSTHCVTVRLPGCSCKRGYVELSGQCVKPSDCVGHTQSHNYLDRIVIE